MTITLSRNLDFIPEFNGNRELEPSEQIRVVLKNLGVGEKETIRAQSRPTVKYDKNGNVQTMELPLGAEKDLLLRKMLVRIENLSWQDSNGTAHPVSSFAQLKDAPMELHELMDEIYTHCSQLLNEEFSQKN